MCWDFVRAIFNTPQFGFAQAGYYSATATAAQAQIPAESRAKIKQKRASAPALGYLHPELGFKKR
jgi:hypothetical protein